MRAERPRLERMGDRAYFTARDGGRWRVYDVGFGPPHAAPGKVRRYPLESARATVRYFVNAERVIRVHQFQRGESHALTTEDLARQLSAAGYLGTTDADVPEHPTR
jgi:hypothetical protein